MNAQDSRTVPPEGGFEPHRLRSITDMKRSREDRMLGGVCAGAAKHLDIDPVIIRVVIGVLTIVGLAGVIIYAAAWFLLPAEGDAKSVAADWFRLDRNEEQVRVAGLVGAVVLAALAVVGDDGWFWDGAPWILVPIALIYYVVAVRPRRHREAAAAEVAERIAEDASTPTTAPFGGAEATGRQPLAIRRRRPDRDRSWTLTWLTVSVAAIAAAATGIWDAYHDGPHWTAYVAVALGVVALGLLASTLIGNGGPLIGIGVLLAVTLAIGSLLPNGKIGAQTPTPVTAAEVKQHYRHGIGLMELDLSDVSNPGAMLGRTVEVESGIGQLKVIVPEDLNVTVTSHLDAGEIRVFDRKVDGTDNTLIYPAASPGYVLTLDLHQRLGNIEVVRR